METRDTIYEEIMDRGFNYELNTFVQSYESQTTLDSAVLIAPLVFFMSPNDPQFLGTLDKILQSPEKGGLTSAGFVFRYDHEKTDDGEFCTCTEKKTFCFSHHRLKSIPLFTYLLTILPLNSRRRRSRRNFRHVYTMVSGSTCASGKVFETISRYSDQYV